MKKIESKKIIKITLNVLDYVLLILAVSLCAMSFVCWLYDGESPLGLILVMLAMIMCFAVIMLRKIK